MAGAHRRDRLRRWSAFLVALLAVALTRAPLLWNPHDHLDGDEALMGVTVLHVLEGRGVPLRPYGAAFGVSAVETLTTATLAWVFALSDTTLRAAPLLLWCLGVLAVAFSCRALAGGAAAGAAALLLIFSPAWLHPSISAWHYNHTAFLAGHLAVWLAVRSAERPGGRLLEPGLIAALASLAFLSQPIYALGASPFLAWWAWRRRDPRAVGVLLLVGAACLLLHAFAAEGSHARWSPPLFAEPEPLSSLRALPHRFWVATTGVYFLDRPLPAGPATRAAAALWCAALLAASARAAALAWRRRRITPGLLCLAAIAAVLGFDLLITPRLQGARYLLPSVGFQAMLIALEAAPLLRWRPARAWLAAAGVAFVALGSAAAATEVRHLSFSGSPVVRAAPESEALQALVRHLLERDIHHVYSAGPMFQWKLVFASRERVLARWIDPIDRHPPYPAAVDRASATGEPVAIVGEADDAGAVAARLRDAGFPGLRVEPVASRYYVIEDPPPELVRRRFPPRS
jgi:hypothetical protein